ncbi:capsular biosynthesis protein [Campylobacter sp. LR264d]|uniref:galactosyltransferase-related protein n=1 Tax=Campylobacter sp. LR264d TaxID=2593544 RepID=UPI0012388D42|nr:galactosyltransferase-related protein [Campylobacter sp. LR264d]KAA6231371.1 capsular biosynthesis protein [Campylobacter sp. LR264d]
MKYSVAIPVDLNLRPLDIIKKTKDILKRASNEVELVFGHNDRGSIFDKYFKKITKKDNVKLASGKFYTHLVCQSLLRNEALKLCSSDFVYIMDVDYIFDEEIADSCINELKNGEKPFVYLPCLYLTRKGSRCFFKSNRLEMFEKFINFRKDLFSGIASPSGGSIFLKKDDYFKIGGFDESFVGRGGEDFEFMIRLGLYHKLLTPSKDFKINKFYKSPILSEGFRKYLNFLSLPYFFEKKVSFHIYHGRNRLRSYFRQYKKNADILDEKIKFDNENLSTNETSLLKLYEELCKKYELSLDKYIILFDSYRPKLFSIERFILFLRGL